MSEFTRCPKLPDFTSVLYFIAIHTLNQGTFDVNKAHYITCVMKMWEIIQYSVRKPIKASHYWPANKLVRDYTLAELCDIIAHC